MLIDTLYTILLAISIIAAIVLVVVLLKAYSVLNDWGEISKISKKRVIEIDSYIDEITKTAANIKNIAKGITNSLDSFGKIKNKINGLLGDSSPERK